MTKYLKKSWKDNKTIDLRVQIMAFNATFNNFFVSPSTHGAYILL